MLDPLYIIGIMVTAIGSMAGTILFLFKTIVADKDRQIARYEAISDKEAKTAEESLRLVTEGQAAQRESLAMQKEHGKHLMRIEKLVRAALPKHLRNASAEE